MAEIQGLKAALGRRTVLAAVISLVGLVGAAHAYGEGDIVDLSVVNRQTGQPLTVWRHDGRLFVAGEQGERYSLRIANHTDGRVLVVLSVDGVNIISGETAGYDGRGYILSPHQSYEISGWRKSETQVAAFSFTSLPNSYAAETGRPGNVGVIGMAVFKERPRPTITPLDVTPAPPPPLPLPPVAAPAPAPPPPAPLAAAKPGAGEQSVVVTGSRIQRRDTVPSPPAASPKAFQEAQRADEKLGTAHGALEWSVSHVVEFHRATPYPEEVRQIEYDSRVRLVAAGVIQEYPPHSFPLGAGGFTPDPPERH